MEQDRTGLSPPPNQRPSPQCERLRIAAGWDVVRRTGPCGVEPGKRWPVGRGGGGGGGGGGLRCSAHTEKDRACQAGSRCGSTYGGTRGLEKGLSGEVAAPWARWGACGTRTMPQYPTRSGRGERSRCRPGSRPTVQADGGVAGNPTGAEGWWAQRARKCCR